MARSTRPDKEGYLYFAQMPSGYLYGPYSDRGTAAGVLTQLRPSPRPRIYSYAHGGYIDNPDFTAIKRPGKVLKAKLSAFEDAPKVTLRDKYENALAKLARVEQMLHDRGIDIQVD
jgi:hypothetical protein